MPAPVLVLASARSSTPEVMGDDVHTTDIVLDTYPDRVFHGTVAAVGAGTGAEFSLLPAQNATGNWVKVTQRFAVRIAIDQSPTDPDRPLRVGASVTATVDTGDLVAK